MLSWIGRSTTSAASELTPESELQDLQDALATTKLIMEDKFDEVEELLSKKTSPFHKYMRSTSLFLRAVLGVEPDIVKKGLTVVNESELAIQEYVDYTQRNPKATYNGNLYPPGTVYSLMHAQLQFLSAIFGIMNANLSDGVKAVLRIRKGYTAMQQLYKLKEDAAAKYRAANGTTDATESRRSFDFTFEGDESSELTAHPVDRFIHTGLCYSYGMLMWALSIVPAPFDKVLAFLAYKGDRKLGHSLMWEASKYPETIAGAMSAFSTLVIYNGLSSRCDIRLPDAVPYDKVEQLLQSLQTLYPASYKWAIQRNIMIAVHDQALVQARDLLQPGVDDQDTYKFIKALCIFEQGCKNLFLQDYEATADSFTEIAKYTDWSYSLFRYVVGISYVDAYRHAIKSGDAKAADYGTKASEALEKVMDGLCSRKVLGKALPIEIWIRSNMNRYLAKAAAQKCDLVDAVDVSPAQELIWLYGGYDAMPEEKIRLAMETIDLYQTTVVEENARKSMLKAACLRALKRLPEAKKELQTKVLCFSAADTRTWDKHAANWLMPSANFELAICYWKEAHPEMKDKEKLQACADHVRTASKWGAHDFQTMMSVKISAALDALRKLGMQV